MHSAIPHQAPTTLKDGSHVETIAYPEPKQEDPDEASRLEDDKERRVLLAGYRSQESLSIARVAQLFGDHFSTYGAGRICGGLVAAAKSGTLRVIGSVDRNANGRKRPVAQAVVDRGAVLEWLLKETEPDWPIRRSVGAIWCCYPPALQAEKEAASRE